MTEHTVAGRDLALYYIFLFTFKNNFTINSQFFPSLITKLRKKRILCSIANFAFSKQFFCTLVVPRPTCCGWANSCCVWATLVVLGQNMTDHSRKILNMP
jgi:hypothetical protein